MQKKYFQTVLVSSKASTENLYSRIGVYDFLKIFVKLFWWTSTNLSISVFIIVWSIDTASPSGALRGGGLCCRSSWLPRQALACKWNIKKKNRQKICFKISTFNLGRSFLSYIWFYRPSFYLQGAIPESGQGCKLIFWKRYLNLVKFGKFGKIC